MQESTTEYIDIHAHILPGVDDGAKTMEESIDMLKLAYSQGIRKIIATPHYQIGMKQSIEQLEAILKKVNENAKKIDRDFNIYLGNEIYYDEGCLDMVNQKKALTLNNSRYVLVEFSMDESYKRMYNGMRDFITEGYSPVIAHIERYRTLWKKEDKILELINLGCYMQVNINSIKGGILDRESANLKKLISNGLIHFIATDTHNIKERKPIMEDIIVNLKKNVNSKIIHNILYENPLKVIENKCI